MTKQEFAESIKAKYPQYQNMDNEALADKIIDKYPVYRSQIEEKSTLRKVGDFFTSSSQEFGKTLGTAASAIDTGIAEKVISKIPGVSGEKGAASLREEALASQQESIDKLMNLAKSTEEPEKKKKYLEMAKQTGEMEGIDIFQNEEYQKTAKQVFGEGLGTFIETAGLSSLGGKGMKSFKLGKDIPTITKPLLTTAKTALAGLKTGAKIGGGFGAAFGASEAMQEDKSLTDIAKSTVTGGLIGGATGGVLGGAVSGVVSGVPSLMSKSSKLARVSRSKVGEIAYNKLKSVSKDLMRMSPTVSKGEARWNKNTPKFLVDEGVINLLEGDGKHISTGKAMEELKKKYFVENEAFGALLEDSGAYVSMNDFKEKVLSKITKEMKAKGSDYSKAKKHVEKEIDSYLDNYNDIGIKQNGDMLLNVSDFNRIKSGLWSKTSNFNPTMADKLSSDINYKMGQVAKDIVEESVEDAGIKSMNSRLGDFQAAMKILENAEGKVLPGGTISQWVTKAAGTALGLSGGGPVGAIVGNLTGGALADVMMNPKTRTIFLDKILQETWKTKKGQSIVEEAARILKERNRLRESRLLLEAPKTINMPEKTLSTKEAELITKQLTQEEIIANNPILKEFHDKFIPESVKKKFLLDLSKKEITAEDMNKAIKEVEKHNEKMSKLKKKATIKIPIGDKKGQIDLR